MATEGKFSQTRSGNVMPEAEETLIVNLSYCDKRVRILRLVLVPQF